MKYKTVCYAVLLGERFKVESFKNDSVSIVVEYSSFTSLLRVYYPEIIKIIVREELA